MLELLLCSLLTVFPDYLYRRYVQGKRLGKEITFYSVWYELRWGITACLMLTVGLITVVFYYHPSTKTATFLFRTVPIVPETIGRVAEINVSMSDNVAQGQPLFKLDDSKQRAAVETARRKIAEVEAGLMVARADVQAAALLPGPPLGELALARFVQRRSQHAGAVVTDVDTGRLA